MNNLSKKALGIVGCGWLGRKLAARISDEFSILASTRSDASAHELSSMGYSSKAIEFSDEKDMPLDCWEVVPSLDVLIVLVPFSIRRATPQSLALKMNNLCRFIGDYNGQLFFASSTGVYPKISRTFTENDLPVEENATENQIKRSYPKANILRLAGLMGDNRLLHKYKVSNLKDPVNHVHYEDVCSVIIQMIKHQWHYKLYNVVAPLHPTKEQVIASQLNKLVPTSPKTIDGRIISSAKLVSELGFVFKYPDPNLFHIQG